MPRVILIAHNIRSCYNIGALLRTAEGLGVEEVVMSGYSPYPRTDNDQRLPHEAEKVAQAIHKTALGAEDMLAWRHINDLQSHMGLLRNDGFKIYAVEQASDSMALPGFEPPAKLALLVGNEVSGIEQDLLGILDGVVEIPMRGKKESYNVAAAAAMVLYHCVFGLPDSKL